jgi:hypothetical protein
VGEPLTDVRGSGLGGLLREHAERDHPPERRDQLPLLTRIDLSDGVVTQWAGVVTHRTSVVTYPTGAVTHRTRTANVSERFAHEATGSLGLEGSRGVGLHRRGAAGAFEADLSL